MFIWITTKVIIFQFLFLQKHQLFLSKIKSTPLLSSHNQRLHHLPSSPLYFINKLTPPIAEVLVVESNLNQSMGLCCCLFHDWERSFDEIWINSLQPSFFSSFGFCLITSIMVCHPVALTLFRMMLLRPN